MVATYHQMQELPDLAISWPDKEGDPVNFASGHTFIARLVRGGALQLEKTSGFVGASNFPNLTIEWLLDELADLEPGIYDLVVQATRTSDGKRRVNNGTVTIKRSVT